jgi:hypothetical protein
MLFNLEQNCKRHYNTLKKLWKHLDGPLLVMNITIHNFGFLVIATLYLQVDLPCKLILQLLLLSGTQFEALPSNSSSESWHCWKTNICQGY